MSRTHGSGIRVPHIGGPCVCGCVGHRWASPRAPWVSLCRPGWEVTGGSRAAPRRACMEHTCAGGHRCGGLPAAPSSPGLTDQRPNLLPGRPVPLSARISESPFPWGPASTRGRHCPPSSPFSVVFSALPRRREGRGRLDSLRGHWSSGTRFCGLCSPPHTPSPSASLGGRLLGPTPPSPRLSHRDGWGRPPGVTPATALAAGPAPAGACDLTQQGDGHRPRRPGCGAPMPLLPLPDRGPATPCPARASPWHPAPPAVAPASLLGLSHL